MTRRAPSPLPPAGRGRRRALVALGAAPLALTLGACGVDVAGVGGEGTGMFAQGRIDGFGSVWVDGRRWRDEDARAVLRVDPSRPQALPLASLRLGMVARLQADGDRALEITIAPEVVGPVQSVDAGGRRLVVAGQSVQLDAVPADPTVLDGFEALSALALGDRVVVHGQRTADGTVRASRLERATVDGVAVTGPLRRDGTGGGWRIGALAVDLTGAVRVPAGAQPAEGDRVAVWAPALSGAVLAASAVEIDGGAVDDAAEARIAGVATEVRGAARLRVHGIEVDASAAAIDGGTVADLREGAWLRVEGPVDDGMVRASRVTVVPDGQVPQVEVTADIGDVASVREFVLRGTSVDAAAAEYTGLSPSNIGDGVRLRVSGPLGGPRLAAAEVRPDAGAPGQTLVQFGTVALRDASRFRLVGLAPVYRLSDATAFIGGAPRDLRDGVAVSLSGTLAGDEFAVAEVRFGGPAAPIEVFGVLGNVEAGTDGSGEFGIEPDDVTWTAQTRFLGATGSAADLADGEAARVIGVREGGVIRALEVDARRTQPGILRLRADATDVTSAESFRVRGLRVDARAAVFEPASLRTTLREALLVDVEGTLVDGVLVASRVSDP